MFKKKVFTNYIVTQSHSGECDDAVVQALAVRPVFYRPEDQRGNEHEQHEPDDEYGMDVGGEKSTGCWRLGAFWPCLRIKPGIDLLRYSNYKQCQMLLHNQNMFIYNDAIHLLKYYYC